MSIFKQFYSSLTDPQAIANLRFQKLSTVFLYVGLLSLLIFLPNAVHTLIDFNSAKTSVLSYISEEDNHFEISDGELSTSIKNSVLYFGNEAILFDASENFESKDAAIQNGASSGFLRDRFFIYENGIVQEFKYSDVGLDNISSSELVKMINNFYLPTVYFMSVISFVSVFIYTLFIITIIAFVSTPIKNTMSKFLTFEQIWKMTAFSMTLVVVFFFIMDFARIGVEFRFAIKWIVTLVILFMSLKTIPSSKIIDENDDSEFDLEEFEKEEEEK
jgi:hypothetical protein